jgi:hypothetical protein
MIIYIIYAFIALSVLLTTIIGTRPSLVLSIANRWIRWSLMALCFAYVVQSMEWSAKPLWLLCVTAFFAWFVIETIYNWLVIKALNKSDIPLFPVYRKDTQEGFWPAFFLQEKEAIEQAGFKKIDLLFTEIGGELKIRSIFFDDADSKIRLQVMFLPQNNKPFGVFYTLLSKTANRLYLTDNMALPFGGFFPENWSVMRRPLSSFNSLYKKHKKRLEAESLLKIEDSALEQVTKQQRLLEAYNTEVGFIHKKPSLSEEEGRISPEGCYRIWKELWLLNYFGKSLTY